MDLVFTISAVVLLSAPIALTAAAFVDRPFGFSSWRGDPWPVGVQEEDLDHSWGDGSFPRTEKGAESLRAEELGPSEPSIVDLDRPASGSAAPVISRLRGSVKRVA